MNKIKCKLVMDDWRQVGKPDSIYSTPLGVDLSIGDMHSGTAFEADVELPPHIAEEIETAWREHGAYPVLRCLQQSRITGCVKPKHKENQ